MNFNIGDQIKYSNKKKKMNFYGEIIGITKYKEYMINVLGGEVAPWYCYNKPAQFFSEYLTINNNFLEVSNNSNNGTFRIKSNRCVKLPIVSRNILHNYIKYDPNQQPDTEEDI